MAISGGVDQARLPKGKRSRGMRRIGERSSGGRKYLKEMEVGSLKPTWWFILDAWINNMEKVDRSAGKTHWSQIKEVLRCQEEEAELYQEHNIEPKNMTSRVHFRNINLLTNEMGWKRDWSQEEQLRRSCQNWSEKRRQMWETDSKWLDNWLDGKSRAVGHLQLPGLWGRLWSPLQQGKGRWLSDILGLNCLRAPARNLKERRSKKRCYCSWRTRQIWKEKEAMRRRAVERELMNLQERGKIMTEPGSERSRSTPPNNFTCALRRCCSRPQPPPWSGLTDFSTVTLPQMECALSEGRDYCLLGLQQYSLYIEYYLALQRCSIDPC